MTLETTETYFILLLITEQFIYAMAENILVNMQKNY